MVIAGNDALVMGKLKDVALTANGSIRAVHNAAVVATGTATIHGHGDAGNEIAIESSGGNVLIDGRVDADRAKRLSRAT